MSSQTTQDHLVARLAENRKQALQAILNALGRAEQSGVEVKAVGFQGGVGVLIMMSPSETEMFDHVIFTNLVPKKAKDNCTTIEYTLGNDEPFILAYWERKLCEAELQHLAACFTNGCACSLCTEGRMGAENKREKDKQNER